MMNSRREGTWDEKDEDEEEDDEVMADQLLGGSLLVRDGGEGANEEPKQGRIRRHPSSLQDWRAQRFQRE